MKFTNKKVAIIGLGMEGVDLVNYLHNEDAKITICDQKLESKLDLSGVKNGVQLSFNCGEAYLDNLKKFDCVFRSPGIYRYKDQLVDAEKHGIKISSAIKLFFDRCPAKIIGVTGTKGKGATSTRYLKC